MRRLGQMVDLAAVQVVMEQIRLLVALQLPGKAAMEVSLMVVDPAAVAVVLAGLEAVALADRVAAQVAPVRRIH